MTDDQIQALALSSGFYPDADFTMLVRAIEQAARRETVERAARICDEWQRTYVLEHCCDLAQHNALKSVADAIRALMGGEKS